LGQPTLQTASIAVQAIGGVPLDEDQVDKIRYYVAAAVAGMKPENVTIADANGTVHIGPEADHGGPDGDVYHRAVRKSEQDLNTKIRQALAYIPNLTVISTVTLDHEKGSRSVEVKNDPKPVPLRTVENSRTSNRESSSAGGAPGVQAQGGGVNQPASLASASGKGTNETNEESKTEQDNAVSTKKTETENYGLLPKSATASVGIPMSYYEKVWQQRNPDGDAKKPDQSALDKIREEIRQDVQKHVATLLPASDGKDPTALVTVTSFQDIKAAEIPTPAMTQKALTWLGSNWPMLAMIGLVLFSLGMLRSMMRSAPATGSETSSVSSARVAATHSASEEKEEPVEATAARRLRRMSAGGPSLRDELSEFVKEDPDSAANVLRAWIGQVT
jgi:flagellar M-ring protein FliF